MQQVVLACRVKAGEPSRGSFGYLERARGVVQLAQAHGAMLVAWGADALAVAWDATLADEAIDLAVALALAEAEEGAAWCCALAQGELETLAPPQVKIDLSWGAPLAAAASLARIAAPREVLLHESLEALRAGELLRRGGRKGKGALKGVRGARLDTRAPRKADCASRVAAMVDPPLVGRGDIALAIDECPGALSIVRAAPGFGGSRVLSEIAVVAPASLVVRPVGLGIEPLGAVRHALWVARGDLILPPSLAKAAEQLFAGEGAPLEVAADLIGFALKVPSPRPGALLVDDAHGLDEASLTACALALTRAERPLSITIRIGPTDPIPAPLADLPLALEFSLDVLEAGDGEAVALGCTGNALATDACRRWARRGGQSPLGIVEAIACGLTTGELAWTADGAFARRRYNGNGRARPVEEWIVRRAEELPAEARAVLSSLAVLGGTAPWFRVEKVLSAVGAKVSTVDVVPRLVAARWLRVIPPDAPAKKLEGDAAAGEAVLALPTRTHGVVVRELISESRRKAWHRAAAQAMAQTAGSFGYAEASQHAFQAGAAGWASQLADEAASAASRCDLAASASRLRAFARACEPPDTGVHPIVPAAEAAPETSRAPSVRAPSSRPVDSERTLATQSPLAFEAEAEPAHREAEPAEAMPLTLSGAPEGEEALLRERMNAIEELSHGQAAHAVDVLSHAHEKLTGSKASSSALCQASLVLGVALAHAGRSEEALLQGLDALARAREGKDAPGERACVTFLLKLFEATSRGKAATGLRAAAAAP